MPALFHFARCHLFNHMLATFLFVCFWPQAATHTCTWRHKCSGLVIGKTHHGFIFFCWPLPFLPDWSGSSRFWWISLITLFIFTSIKNLGTDTLHDDLWTIIIPVNKRTVFPSLSRILSFQQWWYFFKLNWTFFFVSGKPLAFWEVMK